MKKQLIKELLQRATNHGQINEVVNAYGLIILLDNHLEDCLRDARVRVDRINAEMIWEVYQLN